MINFLTQTAPQTPNEEAIAASKTIEITEGSQIRFGDLLTPEEATALTNGRAAEAPAETSPPFWIDVPQTDTPLKITGAPAQTVEVEFNLMADGIPPAQAEIVALRPDADIPVQITPNLSAAPIDTPPLAASAIITPPALDDDGKATANALITQSPDGAIEFAPKTPMTSGKVGDPEMQKSTPIIVEAEHPTPKEMLAPPNAKSPQVNNSQTVAQPSLRQAAPQNFTPEPKRGDTSLLTASGKITEAQTEPAKGISPAPQVIEANAGDTSVSSKPITPEIAIEATENKIEHPQNHPDTELEAIRTRDTKHPVMRDLSTPELKAAQAAASTSQIAEAPASMVIPSAASLDMPDAISAQVQTSTSVAAPSSGPALGTTAPAAAPVPAMPPHAVAGVVINRITNEPDNGDRIVVQLDPPELGRVAIDFKFDGQGLQTVTITGETPEALKQLRLMHFELVQALEEKGISGSDLTFAENPSQHFQQNSTAFTEETHQSNTLEPDFSEPETRRPVNYAKTHSGLDLKL